MLSSWNRFGGGGGERSNNRKKTNSNDCSCNWYPADTKPTACCLSDPAHGDYHLGVCVCDPRGTGVGGGVTLPVSRV